MPYSSSSSEATDRVRDVGGSVVPYTPRCPRTRGSGRSGQRLLPDTQPPGLWRCTFGSPPHVTFHLAVPQLLLPPTLALGPLAASPGTGYPLSSWETLEQFGKVYVVLFGWSVIFLLLG